MTTALAATVPYELPIEQVYPDPRQPRKALDDAALDELAASIRVHGILEPLIVQTQPRTDGKAGYTIVAGERRWRAAKRVGLKTVPVTVRVFTAAQVAEVQLVENLQREDLSALEQATGYAAYLKTTGKSQAELAKALGKDEGTISHVLGLLALPKSVQQLVSDRTLSFAHARELARLVPHPKALARVSKYVDERIHWGNVPTTRTMKRYVDSELDRVRRQLKAAAERAKRKGHKRPVTSAIQQNVDWKREREERARRERTRAAVLKAQLPNIVRTFTRDPFTKLVRKIPPRLATYLAGVIRLPSWGEEHTVAQRLLHGNGKGPYAKIAAALWLRPARWSGISRWLEQATKAAITVETKAAAATAKRKRGGK